MGEFRGGGNGNKCCVSAISNYVVWIFLFNLPDIPASCPIFYETVEKSKNRKIVHGSFFLKYGRLDVS